MSSVGGVEYNNEESEGGIGVSIAFKTQVYSGESGEIKNKLPISPVALPRNDARAALLPDKRGEEHYRMRSESQQSDETRNEALDREKRQDPCSQ